MAIKQSPQPRQLLQPRPLIQPIPSIGEGRRTSPRSSVERRTAERGVVSRGAVDRGSVTRGTVDRGAVSRGSVIRGANPQNEKDEGDVVTPIASPETPASPQPGYGERLKAIPSRFFTGDFKDSDNDGIDDRYQSGAGKPKMKVGELREGYQEWIEAGRPNEDEFDWERYKIKKPKSITDSLNRMML